MYGQYSVASGDPDRQGNSVGSNLTTGSTAGTEERAFQSFGGLSLGYALAPTFANIRTMHFGGTISPWQDLEGGHSYLNDVTLTMAFYKYRIDSTGPTSDPFIPFATETISDEIGEEWNFNAKWKILSDFKSDFRVGYFKPGSAYGSRRAREIYGRYKFTVDL